MRAPAAAARDAPRRELGLDAYGAARAEAYEATERHIRDRRRRGLFAGHALHDGAAGGVVPPRAPAAGRAHRRLGGALLLAAGRGAGARAGPARRATHGTTPTPACASARRARPTARRRLPRARGREPARRPRGRRAQRRRLLRQEHDADHADARLVGRARHARHRRRARADAAARARLRQLPALHRRLPDRRARRAGHARRHPLPLLLDAGAGPDPARSTARRSAHRSTAATSARTSARGTAASSGGARGRGRARASRRRPRRVARGRRPRARAGATTGSTSRGTTRATCGGTRSSRSATPGAGASRGGGPCRHADDDDPLLREHAALGARAGSRSGRA